MIALALSPYMARLSAFRQDQPNGFITELEGIVRSAELVENGVDGNPTIKRVPVPLMDYSTGFGECLDNDPYRLVPDQSKRMIVFFESSPAVPLQSVHTSTAYQANVSLLCWYSGNGFTGNRNNVQYALIAKFLKVFKEPYRTAATDLQVNITPGIIQENDASLFSNYSFSDQNSSYFSFPFACFKINFSFKLLTNESCIADITPIDIDSCS